MFLPEPVPKSDKVWWYIPRCISWSAVWLNRATMLHDEFMGL